MNNATSPAIQQTDFQLSEFIRVVGASLRQLHEHPALAWITPQLPVRLLEAKGGESLWLAGRKLEADQGRLRAARFTAVEVPADLALTRTLVLPPLTGSDLRDAVALDVRDANPFEPSDLVWGYRSALRADGQMEVLAVLASRRQVLQHLAQAVPAAADPSALEVWVLAEDGGAVVLGGFGEQARARSAGRGRMLVYALMLGVVLLATAIAVTPTVQLHLRTLQAVAAYRALQQRAGPAVATREAVVRGREDLANLQEVMADHIEPLVALDMLTQLIPDDTWLQRVQAQGTRFTLSGQTPNAAALMNMLSSNPGLRDVRAPTPATRAQGTSREIFVVEFTVAPGMVQRRSAAVPALAVPPPVPAAAAAATSLPPVPVTPPAVRSQP